MYAAPLPAVKALRAPDTWPDSDDPATWALPAAMRRGAEIVRPHLTIGEAAARAGWRNSLGHRIADYAESRDIPGVAGTSRLSENLTLGEISPRPAGMQGCGRGRKARRGPKPF